MACYISSNQNRFYVALETTAGQAADVLGARRFSAISLKAKQEREAVNRRDKTGSRTFWGFPAGLRRRTDFTLRTYLAGWDSAPTSEPAVGPLFQSALGSSVQLYAGSAVTSVSGANLTFGAAHNLTRGQAVASGGEIRFVAAVTSATVVALNAPFTIQPSNLNPTASYAPGEGLPTVSLFDYWSPSTAVHRIVTGASVDQLKVQVNGDFHEFEFGGPGFDLLDSASFGTGEAGLIEFPPEPNITEVSTTVVPGNLGQAWLGGTQTKFATITEAEFTIDNNIDLRDREFGSVSPRCISSGMREINFGFTLHSRDDEATKDLYRAARTGTPIGVMFQLGQQPGQLFGIYVPSVVPAVPEYEDGTNRLQWKFDASRAQGTVNDEIFVAFG